MSINFYNLNSKEFFQNTFNLDMSPIYQKFYKYLPNESGEILDLGCGSGRDSKEFLDKGFQVISVDNSEELIKLAKEKLQIKVIKMDMRDIEYSDKFIGVWACASLLHIEFEELELMFHKIYTSLKHGGILYASFKYGNGDYIKDNRYFTCMDEEKFKEFYKKIIDKFHIEELFLTGDTRNNRSNELWFNIILRKSN